MRIRDLVSLLAGAQGILAVIAILSLLVAAAELTQPLLVARIISGVEQRDGIGSTVWLLVVLVILSGVFGAFRQYLLQRVGEQVVLRARRRLVQRMLRLPIAEYDHRHPADLVSRLTNDTTMLRAALSHGLVATLGGSVTFFGALIAMALIDPVLLGVTLGVVALSLLAVFGLGMRVQHASTRVQMAVGLLASAAERTLDAIRTVRAANATAREENMILGHAAQARMAGLQSARIAAMVSPVSGIATQVSFVAVLGLGGYRVASGGLSISDLVAFVLFLFMMIMPLNQGFEAVTSVNQAMGAYSRIAEILALDVEGSGEPAVGRRLMISPKPGIEFTGVSFSYGGPAGSPLPGVLHDVTFCAAAGSRLALVGPSGAGKSTVLQLIERFYEVDSGMIRVAGKDITALPREELRALVGYVEQDAPIVSGTIRANLTLAAPGADEAECLSVLETVNLMGLIGRDEQGLDAELGPNGITLSGGERQRLAIARVLIANPAVLLLDESTSSLDGRNEQAMKEAIDSVAHDRTLVIVAHRLSTVVDADRIVVLDGGRVVGTGTHSALLASTPLYRELAEHQLLA